MWRYLGKLSKPHFYSYIWHVTFIRTLPSFHKNTQFFPLFRKQKALFSVWLPPWSVVFSFHLGSICCQPPPPPQTKKAHICSHWFFTFYSVFDQTFAFWVCWWQLLRLFSFSSASQFYHCHLFKVCLGLLDGDSSVSDFSGSPNLNETFPQRSWPSCRAPPLLVCTQE